MHTEVRKAVLRSTLVLTMLATAAMPAASMAHSDLSAPETRMEKASKAAALEPYAVYEDMKGNSPGIGKTSWEEQKEAECNQYVTKVRTKCEKKQKALDEEKKRIEKEKQEAKRQQILAGTGEDSLEDMELPDVDRGFKSWMSYTSVTAMTSFQYALLNSSRSETDENNFRRIGDYYCVALGSYYSREIGDRFLITFSDGTSIKAVLGDQKADKDTDESHRYHTCDGSIVEFIMGSNDSANQSIINDVFPGDVARIQKYTEVESDVF